jgi:hypothetical protein
MPAKFINDVHVLLDAPILGAAWHVDPIAKKRFRLSCGEYSPPNNPHTWHGAE